MKGICKEPKPRNMELSKETRKHEIDGKIFIVKPVFKENGNESVTSILVKLMKANN